MGGKPKSRKPKSVGGNLLRMAWRGLFVLIVNIIVGFISLVLILGENVLWHLDFVDTLYTSLHTDQFAVFQFVFVVEFVIIWGVGMLWMTGFFGIMENLFKKL